MHTLILSSWLRKISFIVFYCSYLRGISCAFAATYLDSELHNANTVRPRSFAAKCFRRSDVSVWSLHSLTKKVQRVEGRLTAGRTLFEAKVIFPALQYGEAAMHVGSPKSFTSQIIHQVQCLHVTNAWLWLAYVQSVQNCIAKSALHRLVCITVIQYIQEKKIYRLQ